MRPTLNQNTDTYNFNYNQGFITGTQLQVAFDNTRITNNSSFNAYSPQLHSTFRATLTQHLLNGFGPGINGRFILEAKNNRRITDSAFRQQILYTINQIENIYWVLVSDYEDVQAKQRALEQSTRLASDNRKQLQIGTLAPLDVLNADNQVSTDTQALITSQTSLEYQQLIMKQAISRNLSDPALSSAPVIPTDRVSLLEMPEERTPVEDLVQKAYANRPEIEQNILNLRNDEITLRATKNGLLPTVDLYGFYGAAALGGSKSPFCSTEFFGPDACNVPTVGYGTVFTNLFNSSGPDKGAGVNINIPLRNRTAQSLQARALLEYRQAEMRLQQLYIQVRIQVINGQYALTNDRAAVQAALAAREYNYQSYQSEVKKLRLGASTTANVLQQERNLATAENNVISTEATYAKDRASLEQLLAQTLDQYGIQLSDAVSGTVTKDPVIPGSGAGKSRAGSECSWPATATAAYGADAPVAGDAAPTQADPRRAAEICRRSRIRRLRTLRRQRRHSSGCLWFDLTPSRCQIESESFHRPPRSPVLDPSRGRGLCSLCGLKFRMKAPALGRHPGCIAAPGVLLFGVQMLQHQRRIRPELRQLLQICLVVDRPRSGNDFLDVHLNPRPPLEILGVTGFYPRTQLAKTFPDHCAVVIKPDRAVHGVAYIQMDTKRLPVHRLDEFYVFIRVGGETPGHHFDTEECALRLYRINQLAAVLDRGVDKSLA